MPDMLGVVKDECGMLLTYSDSMKGIQRKVDSTQA
jgi:hypothetical protein